MTLTFELDLQSTKRRRTSDREMLAMPTLHAISGRGMACYMFRLRLRGIGSNGFHSGTPASGNITSLSRDNTRSASHHVTVFRLGALPSIVPECDYSSRSQDARQAKTMDSSLRHQQTAVCVECRCSSCVLVAEVRFRDVTSARAALAEGGAAD